MPKEQSASSPAQARNRCTTISYNKRGCLARALFRPVVDGQHIFVGAIVAAPDGRVLCQLRDNYPWIVCPGTWSCCPGGSLESGETPEQGVLRELWEEFEIEVSDLRPFLIHVEESGKYAGVYHSFIADLVTHMEEVRCNEGVRAAFFYPKEALDLPQHPVSRIFLDAYVRLKAQ